jgi:hypothetical protein
MRRPVDVKGQFLFLLSVSLFLFSQAASVAILPSALFCERSSLGASWVPGVGYNFTDFSDDLTDLKYNHKGIFFNIIATK